MTVTLAVVAATLGSALAWITADPTATPVTGTVTLLALAANVTIAGTVATAGLLELKSIIRPPAGAGAGKFRIRFCVAAAMSVTLSGENRIVAVTCTGWLADVKPGAEALMIADPKLIPFTCGCVAGVVEPVAMNTLAGVTLTFDGSLLASVTVMPPAGAAAGSVIGNATDWPSPTLALDDTRMVPGLTTVTLAVVSPTLGRALAWIAAEPIPTPVTGTVTLVALAANVTVAGTMATPELLELRLMVRPPAGAGADRFRERF